MADKVTQQKETIEVADAEEVTKTKTPATTTTEEITASVEEEAKSENGDSTKNGKDDDVENGKEKVESEENGAGDNEKVCCVKRKSVSGDAVDAAVPAEGATPEKKAKIDETAEANGEAEVTA